MNKINSLTPQTRHIVEDKSTEAPHTGHYNQCDEIGTYLCRQCGLALFRSTDKFLSSCGWPSFDDEIAGNIERKPDADGLRVEIVCHRCNAHLGHVFTGEYATGKNLRHCVNSLALDFVHDLKVTDSEEAIFAGGCFWGIQFLFDELAGVLKTEAGYTGGHLHSPSYQAVCDGNTGHYEALRIIYDPSQINYEAITQYFFEIHDPTQHNGQGPDIGERYQSRIFYFNEEQKNTARQLIDVLREKGLQIATQLSEVGIFWRAEKYHQDYYQKTQKQPYCHRWVKRF